MASFQLLVDLMMSQDPYCSCRRAFWIVANGSSQRGQRASERLEKAYPYFILVHTPVHASWLNQVWGFVGLTQRKVLTPASSRSLVELAERILAFEAACHSTPNLCAGASPAPTLSVAFRNWPHDPGRITAVDHLGGLRRRSGLGEPDQPRSRYALTPPSTSSTAPWT
jgi:hypothetical protein